MPIFSSRIFSIAALCLVIIAAAATNYLWIQRDQSPPLWDMAAHSARAVSIGEFIKGFHPRSILHFDTIYPPATYLLTGALFIVFGPHEDIPQLSLLFYLVLYLISIYWLALSLWQKKSIGLLAAFLSLSYPLLAHFSRIYDLDYPQTALTVFAVLALVRSRLFSHRLWSVLFAVALAAGLLTKWTFILFLIGPLIALVLTDQGWRKFRERKVLYNIALAAVITATLAAPWYFVHFRSILRSATQTRNNVFSVPYENLFSMDNVFYYARQTVRSLTWPLVIVSVAGVIFAIIRRSKAGWLILAWIFVPYFIMTFGIYSKESRYFLPVFPALALISAWAILSIRRRVLRLITTGFIILLAFFIALETSTGRYYFSYDFYERIGFYNQYGYFDPSTQKVGFGFTRPTSYQTSIKEIPLAIKDDLPAHEPAKSKLSIIVVPNSIFLTAAQIQYFGNLIGLEADYQLSSQIRSKDYETYIGQADYVIAKSGDQGPAVWAPEYLTEIEQAFEDRSSAISNEFATVKSWTVYGIEKEPQLVTLYRRATGCNCHKQ